MLWTNYAPLNCFEPIVIPLFVCESSFSEGQINIFNLPRMRARRSIRIERFYARHLTRYFI